MPYNTTIIDTKTESTVIADEVKCEKSKKPSRTFRKICPKPNIVPITNPILPSNQIKEKIRESLLRSRSINTTPPIDDIKIKIQLPEVRVLRPIKRPMVTVKRDPIAVTETNERNREAAKRYRHKLKFQHDELIRRNKQLELENARLKNAFEMFKKAHEHCDVTQNATT